MIRSRNRLVVKLGAKLDSLVSFSFFNPLSHRSKKKSGSRVSLQGLKGQELGITCICDLILSSRFLKRKRKFLLQRLHTHFFFRFDHLQWTQQELPSGLIFCFLVGLFHRFTKASLFCSPVSPNFWIFVYAWLGNLFKSTYLRFQKEGQKEGQETKFP